MIKCGFGCQSTYSDVQLGQQRKKKKRDKKGRGFSPLGKANVDAN